MFFSCSDAQHFFQMLGHMEILRSYLIPTSHDKGLHTQVLVVALLNQQRGFPLWKYFIPVCIGRGVKLGFENSSGRPRRRRWRRLEIWDLVPWD